jgi:heavy metal translocating P-type ATPase
MLKSLLRQYPIAAFALCGLALGACAHFVAPRFSEVVFATVAVAGGLPLIWRNGTEMIRGHFYVDTIASLAIIGAVALGQYLAAALVVLMQSGGQAIEDYGLRRANRSLDNLLRRAPSIAHRRQGTEFVDVPAAEVNVGDVILVRPGDLIAADGVVIEGSGNVDEAAMTGEPVPLTKQAGDRVYSGTVNLNGNFLVCASSTAAESKYELIVRMVQRAQGERAPINRLANRYTPVFTAATLLIAAGIYLFTHDPVRSLTVLVVATPCPLIIATPLAVLSAVNKMASLNIIVKSGAAIEQSGNVDVVMFDKTGTLTSGDPALSDIRALSPRFTADDILRLCSPVEIGSVHVLAESVVREARSRGYTIQRASDISEVPGKGVAGQVGETAVAIGSAGFLASRGIAVPADIAKLRATLASGGRTVAVVAVDCRVEALLVFEDRLRPEAYDTLQRLKKLGMRKIMMLTGDTAETAASIAREVGIEDFIARLTPDDKLEKVKVLSRSHAVMMVGDGINDAPALATASVGVALGGHGAGIATDAADVVITVDNMERVADIIIIGRTMTAVARQGILFGIGASLLLMVLATAGLFPPATGALFQEIIDLAAILNALRAR